MSNSRYNSLYRNFLMGHKIVESVDYTGSVDMSKAARRQRQDFIKAYKAKGFEIKFQEPPPLEEPGYRQALDPAIPKQAVKYGPSAPGLLSGTAHDYFAGFAGKVGSRETNAKTIKSLLMSGQTKFDVDAMVAAMDKVDTKTQGQWDGRAVKTPSEAEAFGAVIAAHSTGGFDIRKRYNVDTNKTNLDFISEFIAARNLELNIQEGQEDLNKILQRKAKIERNKKGEAASNAFATMAQVQRYRGALRG